MTSGTTRTTRTTAAEVMAATGIRSVRRLRQAERELQRHGLVKIDRTKNGDAITLLDPSTGLPLHFPENGLDR